MLSLHVKFGQTDRQTDGQRHNNMPRSFDGGAQKVNRQTAVQIYRRTHGGHRAITRQLAF